jgi:hypothetical protein
VRTTLSLFGIAAALVLYASPAAAIDNKAEAAAKAALKTAATAFRQHKVDDAIQTLADALNGCGDNGCSNPTKAALLRDLGSARLKQSGGRGLAEQALVAALETDPRTKINPVYDSPDLQAEWTAAQDEAKMATAKQPEGDFTHTPAAEQAVNTPLPVYVTYEGTEKVTKVIVHYLAPGEDSPQTVTLKKRSGGFGALVPCAAITRGVFRYWIEGQDKDGNVVATAGGANEPYFVPIHASVDGPGPSLPGARPPKSCDECPTRTPACDGEGGGAQHNDDSPFNTGERTEGGEEGEKHEEAGAPFARFWIGGGASIELMSMPSGSDVCKLTNTAAPSGDYYCTNGDGSDFPTHASPTENNSLAPGNAGSLPGGFAAHDLKIFLSVDYAFNPNLMAGLRLGWIPSPYPGKAAVTDGHDFSLPLHVELRGTYLFGKDALAHAGFAPLVIAGGGVSEFHGQNQVVIAETGVPGSQHKEAWFTAGPLFFEVGGGARYAISPRFALIADGHLTIALGGIATWFSFTPEASFQVGF